MYQIFLAFFLFSCFYFLRHAQSCVHKDKNGSSSIWLNKTDHLHKAVFLSLAKEVKSSSRLAVIAFYVHLRTSSQCPQKSIPALLDSSTSPLRQEPRRFFEATQSHAECGQINF